jgi:sirohydrochlorin ferrochelatase
LSDRQHARSAETACGEQSAPRSPYYHDWYSLRALLSILNRLIKLDLSLSYRQALELNSPSAYLLVSHGSRDPRPQLAVEALAQMLRHSWPHPASSATVASSSIALAEPQIAAPPIATACLELAPQPLHEQIRQFGERAVNLGYRRLVILPLFLLAGVHVRVDLPTEVSLAQQALGRAIELDLSPHLGSHPDLEQLLAQSFAASAPSSARILLTHGSRRAQANQVIAALAMRLQAIPAYWSIAPSLSDCVSALVMAGQRQIAIVPYFLFTGGITDAIGELVIELRELFPDCQIDLSAPLGATPQLALLALELLASSDRG